MVNFSAVCIARNESKTLPRLIKSLEEFQRRDGEIVVVDTGSIDGTPDVALKLGCKVFEVSEKFMITIDPKLAYKINKKFVIGGEVPMVTEGHQLFDFASARNFAASQASNEMVVAIDCDEFFTVLDIDKIEQFIRNGFEQLECHFIFSRFADGQIGIQFRHCRFYDRRKVQYQGVIHEILVGQAKTTYLPRDVAVFEHQQQPDARRSNYLPGLALDCYKHPDNDRNSHYFGREMVWTGRPQSAIKELTRHVAMNKWAQERGQSMIFIGDAYAMLGRTDKALQSYHEAFLMDGSRREPLLKLAEHFWRKGDAQKASCYASASLEISPNDCYCNYGPHYTYVPHEILYWAQWILGNKKRSKEHWEKALAYYPTNPKFQSDRQFYMAPEKPVIPKRIFTIWLSETVMPTVVEKCIESQRAIPGYEHALITLENCPRGIPYLDAAIASKNWTKASDFLRMHELYERGGIYLDADMEVLPGKIFDNLVVYNFFAGSEENRYVMNAAIGSIPKHPLIKQYLDALVEKFKGDDGKVFEAAQELFTPMAYEATRDPLVKIFPPDYFCPYNHQTGTINVTSNTRTFHHALKSWVSPGVVDSRELLPKIAILIPTLGREEGLKRCLTSVDHLYYPKQRIRIWVDAKDGTVPQKVNRMYKKAKKWADCFVYAANDTEFEPYSLYRAVMKSKQHGLVSFNTGPLLPNNGNICEHFLIRKDMVEKIGNKIFCERFHHVGCDNLLWAKGEKLGEAVYAQDAVMIHHHFSRGGQMDEVYEKGWSQVEQDRTILAEELELLEAMS